MKLRPSQAEAARWLKYHDRAIYADPRGAGKTATVLHYLEWSGSHKVLVVAPLGAVIHHWEREVEKWSIGFETVDGTGTSAQRKRARNAMDVYRAVPTILIVNYEAMRQDAAALVEMGWDTVVFDEAHRLKNHKTLVFKAAAKLVRRADAMVAMTGTPIMNRAYELWTLLHLCDPQKYGSFWNWTREYFEVQTTDFWGRVPQPIQVIGAFRPGMEDKLREELRSRMLYRTLDQIGGDLPEVVTTPYLVDLSADERKQYDSMAKRFWADMNGEILYAPNEVAKITRLRQLATGYGSKVKAAAELIEDLFPEQVVVLSSHKAPLYALETALRNKASTRLYTGDQSKAERATNLEQFRNRDVRCMLGTYGAMSEGVDGLQVARHVVQLDEDWTPARNDQAIGRLARRGSEHSHVFVYPMVARNTIDEYVREALDLKQGVIDSLVGKHLSNALRT